VIIFLQILLGAAVVAWHLLGGLPPLAAIPLTCFLVAFVGLWRRPRQAKRPRTIGDLRRQLGLAANQNPSPEQIAAAGLGIVARPPAPQAPPFRNPPPALQPHPLPPARTPAPARGEPCRDTLAEHELADRFERESG
jgi:hypothetical protein